MGFISLIKVWRGTPTIFVKDTAARPNGRSDRSSPLRSPINEPKKPESTQTRAALVSLGLAVASLFVVAGCGGSDDASNAVCRGDCTCSGSTCTCKTGGTCSFGPVPITEDAGTDAGSSTALPNDVTYHCDSKGSCDLTCGSGCTATCAGRSTCAGACTTNCTSTCAGTSECTLETGTNSTVTCTGGSDCTLSLDTGSTVTCDGNSSCTIRCPKGGCTAECGGSSSCNVECGGTTACNLNCNGSRTEQCAPGSTCTGACGGPR